MTNLKTIVYDYYFNYCGDDRFEGKIVTGASVLVAVRPYKNNAEIKFENEKAPHLPDYKCWFDSVFDVSFDRENIFNINRNIFVDKLFRRKYGFDEIKAEVVGYTLDVAIGLAQDIVSKELADMLLTEFGTMPVSEPVKVSEETFRDFILKHLDDFDISDNKKAQCTSAMFV